MQELKIKGIYKHFKGDYYLVEDIAKDSETKEEMVLSKYSDVIHLPYINFDEKHYDTDYSKRFGALSIDIKPDDDYIRLFVTSYEYRIAVSGFIGSDFFFNVVEIENE